MATYVKAAVTKVNPQMLKNLSLIFLNIRTVRKYSYYAQNIKIW